MTKMCSILLSPALSLKSFPDDLAGVGNENECARLILADKAPQRDSLIRLEYGKHNVIVVMTERSVRFKYGGTAVKRVCNEGTDSIRIAAYDAVSYTHLKIHGSASLPLPCTGWLVCYLVNYSCN